MQSQGTAGSATTERKPKTIFQLDTPFTTIQWPDIPAQNQNTILELLCSLISPIGQHRANHTTPSKGKRNQKRKRREAKPREATLHDDTPPSPEISSFVVVGLNSITRMLEASSEKSKPTIFDTGIASAEETPAESSTPEDLESKRSESHVKSVHTRHFSVIFVPKSSQPSILHAHLPQLVTTASLAYPGLPATRLVQLEKGSDARICEALKLPRASFIGIIEGAPYVKALVELVRECVPEVDVPWLREVKKGEYLPVKINAVETFAPVVKDKERKKP
ncbi:hypothetical protein BGZ60DRAFT_23169 [Tricladium varicosporioides]|nr:hypothetical protein BGZ60DRAFT_23169 [Hymenoscyphus varicosporioides]